MKSPQPLFAFSALALVAGAAAPAYAAGTPAGTVIATAATASFSTGTSTTSITSNQVSVKVDELINVTVNPLTTSPVAASSGPATLVYQVTNNGNGNEPFTLTALPNVSGNAFNTTVQTVEYSTDGGATYTVLANGAASPALAPDTPIKVQVLVTLPATATDATTSQVQLTAASVLGTGKAGTLLAGKGNGGVDAVIGLSGGQGTGTASVVASLATVALIKSATILDPFGTANPVPGAIVTYTLVASATGTGSAAGVVVTDAFPANTTYQPGTLTLNGTALTDAADADAGTVTLTGTTPGISVALGTMNKTTASQTITFKVKIN